MWVQRNCKVVYGTREAADHNSNLESIQACYESLGVLIIVDVRTQLAGVLPGRLCSACVLNSCTGVLFYPVVARRHAARFTLSPVPVSYLYMCEARGWGRLPCRWARAQRIQNRKLSLHYLTTVWVTRVVHLGISSALLAGTNSCPTKTYVMT